MYDIEIDYTTGNSFGLERSKEMLGNPSNLHNAKRNLARIKSHYLDCKDHPNTGREYSLTLLTDDNDREIVPFWIGYFEELHGAKIKSLGDSDVEFSLEY